MGPNRLLARRMAELDAEHVGDPVGHAVQVLSTYHNTAWQHEPAGDQILAAAAADDTVRGCRLLAELASTHPALTAAPPRDTEQHWVGLARHAEPSRDRFVPLPARLPASPKPFQVGLYTCVGLADLPGGMWRAHLELWGPSDLYPRPLHTWHLPITPAARVLQIGSATAWVRLLDQYGHENGGLTYPDWHRIAADHDAVRLTLPAVIAAQGFRLPTRHGLSAPAYWDVEQTFWLAWCFGRPRRLDQGHSPRTVT